MTRLKLGRRVVALLLSALLFSASVLPAFATSASGQLPEVGWAETVSSFLMASGIYPFESDAETGYEEWSVSSLKVLWDEFRDDVTQVSYDIVDLTGSLVKGVIAIASGRWSLLREFATWIVNKYNVTDNQTGVELGGKTSLLIPFTPLGSTSPSSGWLSSNGVYIGASSAGARIYVAANGNYSSSPVYLFGYYPYDTFYRAVFLSSVKFQLYSSLSVGSTENSHIESALPGYYCVLYPVRLPLSTDVPLYDSYSALVADVADNGLAGTFQGVTADTTTVSVPAALPEGTDFGGLAVSGTGVAVTPEQLEEIVQNAVKEALKPSVAVVPVAISPDVSVNPSGEITLSGDVTIDTGNIPLQPSDYSAPNLTQVFPFSIPWDMLALLNALDAEPVRPEFDVDLYIPVLDVHVPWTIGVSEALQEPVDSFMASMRLLLLVAMCVATLWVFWRSNL